MKNKNFKLIRKEKLKDIQSEYYEFEYTPLGTKIVWIKNKDQDRAFTAGFRTPPTNNKGINHILEHSVLRGSRKYPFEKEEVFSNLAQKSIYTFLNATTYPDRTIYPFSSNNEKEFLKILDVYLDAVLFPKVLENEKIFEQEGWRYDVDEKGEIFFNGVVFNEMKGRYSDVGSVIWEGQTKNLFPKTIYSLESGGDPKEIIKLKYKELKSYHEDFYHPSNSILYFYGDLNIEKIFEYLEKEFFQFFKKKKINSKISKPKKIKERVKTKIKYFSENENENILSFNFVIGDSLNQKEILKNQILLNILLGSDSSIFKKKLLETGLISKIETHIETDLNTVFWEINLKGLKKKDLKKIERLFLEKLDEVIKEGIPEKDILVELNQMELFLKMQSLKIGKGLEYSWIIMKAWNYNFQNISNLFNISKLLKELKKEVFEKKYFEKLIKKNFVKNDFSLILTLIADSKIDTEKEIKSTLKKINTSSESNKKNISKKIEEFKKWQNIQENEENLKLIKTLDKKYLPKNLEKYSYKKNKNYIYEKNSGLVSTYSIAFDIDHLNLIELQKLKLILNLINKNKIETEKFSKDEIKFLRKKLFASLNFNLEFIKNKKGEVLRKIILSFTILSENKKEAFNFLNEIFNNLILREKDFEDLIKELKINFKDSLAYQGRSFAIYQNLSNFDLDLFLKNQVSGLDYFEFLDKIDTQKTFLEVQNLYKNVFYKKGLVISEHSKKEDKKVFDLVKIENKQKSKKKDIKFKKKFLKKAYAFDSLRNSFNSLVIELENKKNKTEKYLTILSLLNYDYLWKKIREEGGAYGAGTSFVNDKLLVLASHMDSRIDGTYEDFLKITDFLKNLNLSSAEENSLIVKKASDYLKPLSELSFAYRNLLYELSAKKDRQKKYKEVFNFKAADLKKIANELEKNIKNISLVTLANKNEIKKSKIIK